MLHVPRRSQARSRLATRFDKLLLPARNGIIEPSQTACVQGFRSQRRSPVHQEFDDASEVPSA
jgi:hypothetical protein